MKTAGMAVMMMAVMVLGGCANLKTGKKSTVTPQSSRPVTGQATVTPPAGKDVSAQLSTCLFEAGQLIKLSPEKYREQVNALYEDIRGAKYYASVAGNLSAATTDTITPLYQFRVNDACNTVSQLLLQELKQGSRVKEAQP
ncbi:MULTISPECIES: hypothetical protein [Enterobacter]|uniref:hypothetical protein n=1 Tax=Enterobacter TaxID=547 RepID=UPI0012E95B5E|nr:MULTISPECIES: hypothetical protein [Enterobacter]EKS6337600.1 hypothetical protein [Enterobacter hormaechei]